MIAYCARVSNPMNQQLGMATNQKATNQKATNQKATNEKLVRYLIEHQHWSPLEMVSICLEVVTTRDISRQILRHRSFSFQEFSQRYAVQNGEFDYREARLQDTKNRQNSLETDNEELHAEWKKKQEAISYLSRTVYDWAIDNGIAKEQARAVLPEGMTQTRLYMNGTLRSWVHYIQLRTEKGTQKEHRAVALACASAISEIFPMIMEFVQE
jgi:thymidylate synthase (FAD)